MKKTIIYILFSLSLVLAVILFVAAQEINGNIPCEKHNVWGYAWSDNIGWISLACENEMIIGEGFNYGVNIDIVIEEKTGYFSGYAWSDNVGWIKFDPVGPYPATPDYSAKLNLGTGKITGWIRACSGTINRDCNSATRTDGWNGWILLGPIIQEGTDYGVQLIY